MNEQQEREAFEAWMRSCPGHQSLAKEYMNETSGRYDSPYTNLMWEAWQARAAAGVKVVQPLSDEQILACNNTAAEDQEFSPCITAPDEDLIAFARQVLRAAGVNVGQEGQQ